MQRSARTPWYAGPALLGHLETLDAAPDAGGPFRMPVQWVNRPDPDFRGICGTVAAGRVAVGGHGSPPAGRNTMAVVRRIIGSGTDQPAAGPGDAVTLVLDDIDVSRGDVLADPAAPPDVAGQFQAHLVWTDAQPLLTGRAYLFKLGDIARARHRHPHPPPHRRQHRGQAGRADSSASTTSPSSTSPCTTPWPTPRSATAAPSAASS